ncbi:hypothetical protein V8E53_004152 [Lactarius tabidus]
MGYIQPRQPGIVALCTGKQKDIGDDLSTGQVETRLVQRRYAVDSVLGGILGKMLSMSRSQHRWLFVGVPEDTDKVLPSPEGEAYTAHSKSEKRVHKQLGGTGEVESFRRQDRRVMYACLQKIEIEIRKGGNGRVGTKKIVIVISMGGRL